MSDLHRQIVIETFATEDDAIRAVQGLRAAGFDTDDITLAGRDHDDARRVAEMVDVEATDEWPDNGQGAEQSDTYRIVVKAGEKAAFARRVMIDGLVDATGFMHETDESIYLDSGTDSGFEGNTGTRDDEDDFPG